jgi:hypothetical protein
MNFSATDVFAFSDSLIDFIRNSYDDFSDQGINVEAWLTELEEKKQYAEYFNSEQKKLKAVQKELNSKEQNALAGLYDTLSTKLNALIVAIGKKSGLGKQAAEIRSKVHIQKKKTEEKVA